MNIVPLGRCGLGIAGLFAFAAIFGCAAGSRSITMEQVRARVDRPRTPNPAPRPPVSRDDAPHAFALNSPGLGIGNQDFHATGRDEFAPPLLSDLSGQSESGGRRTPLPGFAETVARDLSEWPAVFWQDTRNVFTNRQNLVILGLTYGASLAVQETGPDDTIEHSFESHSLFKKDARDAFGVLGNPGLHFGLAGIWYVVGQQRQDVKTYDVGTKMFRALALNGVITVLGHTATWDQSPNGEWGTFPSGHTSSTFALASVMHHEYGPVVGVPLYALGTLVGMSRLEDGEHYFSDVLMGGVLGLVVGHTIANDGKPPELFGGMLTPYVDPHAGATGVAWVKRF